MSYRLKLFLDPSERLNRRALSLNCAHYRMDHATESDARDAAHRLSCMRGIMYVEIIHVEETFVTCYSRGKVKKHWRK